MKLQTPALPCPFCGCADLLVNDFGPGEVFIQCEDCTTTGPDGADLESACLQWNLRHASTEYNALLFEKKAGVKTQLRQMDCLKCGRAWLTTPDTRICDRCKHYDKDKEIH